MRLRAEARIYARSDAAMRCAPRIAHCRLISLRFIFFAFRLLSADSQLPLSMRRALLDFLFAFARSDADAAARRCRLFAP